MWAHAQGLNLHIVDQEYQVIQIRAMAGSMTRFGYVGAKQPKEIDLRTELQGFLFGSSREIAKAHYVLVRRFKHDSEGRRLACTCNFHNEGSNHPKCSQCLGEGYYWVEEWVPSFKYEIGSPRRTFLESGGSLKTELTKFYFRHNIDIGKDDRIIEVKVDANGDMIKPHERKQVWMIQDMEEKRSDNGRLEYMVVYCTKHNVASTDYSRR